jgi:uncharacterized delta-60 repeat protein
VRHSCIPRLRAVQSQGIGLPRRPPRKARPGLESLEGRRLLSLTDNLIGYWPLDGSGADVSAGARNLTLYGKAGFAAGLFGQALDLHNNGKQYARRPTDDAVFDFGSTDFTVQVWVNFNGDPSTREQTLFEKFSGATGPGWTVTKLAGNQFQFYSNPSGVITSTARSVAGGVWHQVLARRSGTQFDLFLDGVRIATGTDPDPVADTSMPLLLGKRNDQDGRNFAVDGRLDEAAIWGRALSNAEVAALYNGGAGAPVNATGVMYVRDTTPALGSTLTTAPSDFTVDFSMPYDPATLQPGDLMVNGVPADSVTPTTVDTATFHYNTSPVTTSGGQTIAMAAGAVAADPSAAALLAFSGSFTYEPPPPPLPPPPAVLDTAFGGEGTGIAQAVGSFSVAGGYANPVAIQPSTDPAGNAGKILVVGDGFKVVRYRTDGTLDPFWGGTGVVTTAFGAAGATASAVAFQPDGKIVVGGWTTSYVVKGSSKWRNTDFALARYNPDGTLDTSFGQGGKVITDLAPWDWKTTQRDQSDLIKSIVLQPDGKILVAGGVTTPTTSAGLARYNPNGTLDTTFGTGGKVISVWDSYTTFLKVGLQVIGGTTRIVAFGVGLDRVPYIARYGLNGSLDATFGSGGRAVVGSMDGSNSGGAILPDGSILVGGSYRPVATDMPNGMAVAKLTPNGQLDTTFDGDGLAVVQFDDYSDAFAMAVQPNGSIVLGGSVRIAAPEPHSVAALARITATGQLDTSFNETGRVIHASNSSQIYGLALQADGNIVAAGNGPQAIVARYRGGSEALRTAAAAPTPVRQVITPAQVRPVLAQALAWWRTHGADISALGTIDVAIADMGGDRLGAASGATITLDDDAAGWGWSVGHLAGQARAAQGGRMSLLMALVHEVGHLLGHDHDEGGVMAETLSPGVRVLPEVHSRHEADRFAASRQAHEPATVVIPEEPVPAALAAAPLRSRAGRPRGIPNR